MPVMMIPRPLRLALSKLVHFFTRTFNFIVRNIPMPAQISFTPLVLTADQGYGYFPARPGLILKGGRYKISRMLGIGQTSSVFLVRDLKASANGYVLRSRQILTWI